MYRDEMPEQPEPAVETVEERAALRRRQLDRLLSYKGKIDLDLDQETLERLRLTP
jgi:hypothetical protein